MYLNRLGEALLPFLFSVVFYSLFFVAFFSPALLEGRILGPGDGYVFYYPGISIEWKFWESNILSGYPIFADPQFLIWYPPRWIFRDFNFFVVFAYVAASSFTFLFVYSKFRSVAAALISGIIYGSGSFMVAHLGHTSIIHAGAWLPLIAWSIDALADRRTATRFVIGTLAVALCFLGGHPQIFVYAMILAGSLALRNLWIAYREGRSGTIKLASTYAGMVALGVSACAVQILPFLEFRELSARSEAWSYSDFVTYSLPLRQLSTLLFPYLYGGGIDGPIGYFGAWNQTEVATYAGAGVLFMATCATMARKDGDGSLFWLCVALSAILFATSGYNYLGHLFYQIPVINSFRASARMAMVYTFAIAVLAGIAIVRLESSQIRTRHIALAAAIVVAFAVITGLATLSSEMWQERIYSSGDGFRALGTAILLPTASLVAITCVFLLSNSLWWRRVLSGVIIAAVAVDVGLFGWYYEWQHSPVKQPISTQLNALREDLLSSNGRLLAMPDTFDREGFYPNTNLLYGIPSVSGYGPLEPKAYQDATGIGTTGVIDDFPNPGLRRLLGITHLAFSRDTPRSLRFGSCSTEPSTDTVEVELPISTRATEIRIVSNMSCSVNRADNDPVLTFNVVSEGVSEDATLLAGRDTSEWAYDRSDVRDIVRHARAPIASSFEAGGFNGHSYIARLPLGASEPIEVKRLVLHSEGAKGGVLDIQKLELINGNTGEVYPLSISAIKLGNAATISEMADNLLVAKFQENVSGLAWLVNEVRSASTENAAQIVRRGAFPDGQTFDPEAIALIDGEAPKLAPPPAGQSGKVSVVSEDAARLSLRVEAPVQSFLFLSRSYHPGWEARVNGEKVPLYRANAAFQGIVVPSGSSDVTFALNSRTLAIGALVSLISLSILVGVLLWPLFRRCPRSSKGASQRHPGVQLT